MIGVFKVRSRGLFREDPIQELNELVGVFAREDYANALLVALNREQMERVGTVLNEYEIRSVKRNDLLDWKWKC